MTALSAKGSFHVPVRPGWLAQVSEVALDPSRRIIDPHHHLWDRNGSRYLLPDLLADIAGGHRVVGTVYLEARWHYRPDGPESLRPVGETAYAGTVAAECAAGALPLACAGIVGRADLMLGEAVQEVLDKHAEAGGGRFRGVRYSTARDADASLCNPNYSPPAGLLADARFRRGFSRLGPNGLSFDAWVFHPQLDEVTDLARAFPDTTIVLDHCGGPVRAGAYAGRDEEVFATWRAGLSRVAACGNVVLKLGGLGMWTSGFGFHNRELPPASEELAAAWNPYFDACIAAFGPHRCMFESNFPVDKGSFGYGVFWNACKRIAAGYGLDEQDDLFSRTAARIYRLEIP